MACDRKRCAPKILAGAGSTMNIDSEGVGAFAARRVCTNQREESVKELCMQVLTELKNRGVKDIFMAWPWMG
jgi:hypothetical protein